MRCSLRSQGQIHAGRQHARAVRDRQVSAHLEPSKGRPSCFSVDFTAARGGNGRISGGASPRAACEALACSRRVFRLAVPIVAGEMLAYLCHLITTAQVRALWLRYLSLCLGAGTRLC